MNIRAIATTIAGIAILVSPRGHSTEPYATPGSTESLKGKSDQELLDLVVGSKSTDPQPHDEEYERYRAKFSGLDRLWEMPSPDAALALVSDYVGKDITGIHFEIDDPKARPPSKGEIGLRWISG